MSPDSDSTRPRMTESWQKRLDEARSLVANALADPVVLDATAPMVDAFYEDRIGDEDYLLVRHRLIEVLENRHPGFLHVFGRGLWIEANLIHPRLELRADLKQALFEAYTLRRIPHLSTTNPLGLRPNGDVGEGELATARDFHQLRDYFTSLRKAGKSGRPSRDGETARRAAQLSGSGLTTRQIAEELGIAFDAYDRKSINRARNKVRRLVERGRLPGESASDLGGTET